VAEHITIENLEHEALIDLFEEIEDRVYNHEVVVENLQGTEVPSYEGQSSYQVLATDLEVGAAVGTSEAGDTSHIGPIMGNLIGADLTKTRNYLFGVAGKVSVTGTKSSTYPVGGVLGIVADEVTDVDGAVVAVLDGDSAQTIANAAFKARGLNSTPGSGFNYGVDLYDDGGSEYPDLAILKADIRCSNNVCILNGSGAPVDGTTGDNFAGPGSLYIDYANGNAYLQTSLITTPVWKLITRAA
jgi:hypothetical protein